MIIPFDLKYINDIYRLGNQINNKFDQLYDCESLCDGVNKTYLFIIEKKVVGFIHIQDIIDEVDIIDLIIDENYRRKGYASRLLDFVKKFAHSKRILLEVNELNISARNLYLKNGFTEISKRKGYYNGTDAIIMEMK